MTIAAIATPLAVGGISIIRISGERAIEIADRVFQAQSGIPLAQKAGYTAAFGQIMQDGKPLDTSVATVFRAPKSYTGEDVVELSCHGGVMITREVLRVVLEQGAVLAEPGEFTKRAFLNGKLNLTQAEAVVDLIQAGNRQAMNAARAQMGNALYRKIEQIRVDLLAIAGHLGAWVDYPEEEIPEVDQGHLLDSLRHSIQELARLIRSFDTGKLVREGIETVIAGKPNVGKSTLMNLLAGCRRSIVTDIAGTTRDVVEETVSLGEWTLRLADTAGIRVTDDQVEQAGVELARARLGQAQLILAVFDSSQPLSEEDRELICMVSGKPVIAVVNKSDLPAQIEWEELEQAFPSLLVISAQQDQSLSALEEKIGQVIQSEKLDLSAGMIATERQRSCAEAAMENLQEAAEGLEAGITLDAVTVSIDSAIHALLELTGGKVTEEVVNQVFSHFCVGK